MRRIGGEQRRGVGADGEEGDEAKIEQAGQADLQIEAHAHQDVEPDQHQHLADIRAGDCRQQHKTRASASPAQIMRSRRWSRAAIRAARRRRMEPSTSLAIATTMKIVTRTLRAEALPGVDEVAEFADRSLVLLQHELDQFLEHAGDQHGDRARNDRASHDGGTDAQRRTQQTGDRATADQDDDARGEADCPSVSMSNRSGDNAMKIDCSGTTDMTTVSTAIGTPAAAPAMQPWQRASRHRPGAPGDHQQHRLTEAQRVDDDPALVQHQQHADHREMHRAGAEGEANQDCAAHQARFLAMRSPSSPCGRKISTMISSVKAIRSRNW